MNSAHQLLYRPTPSGPPLRSGRSGRISRLADIFHPSTAQDNYERGRRDVHSIVRRRLRQEGAALSSNQPTEPDVFRLAMDALRADPPEDSASVSTARERELMQRFRRLRENTAERTNRGDMWGEVEIDSPPESRPLRRRRARTFGIDDPDDMISITDAVARNRSPRRAGEEDVSGEGIGFRRYSRPGRAGRYMPLSDFADELSRTGGHLGYMRRSMRVGDYMVRP